MLQILRAAFLVFVLSAACQGIALGQVASFTASTTSGCAPLLVQFNSTSSGTITSYNWTLGNGATVATSNSSPSTTYTTPGTYTVTLNINGPGGSTVTKTNYITVHPNPTVNFSYSGSSGCAPLTASFTSSVTPGVGGPVTYTWYYGNGFTGSGANSTHTYSTGGTYSVTLTATNSAGCSNSQQQVGIITAYPKPGGTFLASPTIACSAPATISFTNTAATGTSPYQVYWDFGNGANNNSNNPTYTYTTSGSFTVKLLTIDANGCKDTMVKNGYITVHAPIASISAPTLVCLPNGRAWTDSVMFKNTTPGGSSTVWDFGDSTGGSGDSLKHAFNGTQGTYTVRMITLVNTCPDTAYHTITVAPGPNYTVNYTPQPNCGIPATLSFSTTPAATSYQWWWYTGGTSTSSFPSKTYNTGPLVDTTYVIAADANGCKDTLTPLPTYVHNPFINVFGPVNGCAPMTAVYTARIASAVSPDGLFPDSAVSFYWDFGDGGTSTSDTPSHTYTTYGIYNLAVKIVTKSGCVILDTIEVKIGTKIPPDFSATPNPVCVGQQVYFTNLTNVAPSATISYTWDVGDGAYTAVNGTDAIYIYQNPGVYTVKLISHNNGCDDTAIKVNWMVVNGPNAMFVDTVLCINQHRTVSFHNQSIGATSQTWHFGNGDSSTAFSPTYTYPVGGTYNVTLFTYNNITGCRDTFLWPVTVGTPIMSFKAADSTLCVGDTLKLTNTYVGPTATIGYTVEGATLVNGPNRNITYYVMTDTGYHTVRMISTILFQGSAVFTNCSDTVSKINYVYVSKPDAGFKAVPPIGCSPVVVTFTDTSKHTPGTIGASRYWTFGNGNSTNVTTPSITETYTSAGNYAVTLIVTDANGCKDTAYRSGYVNVHRPLAAFDVIPPVACVGAPITFVNNSSTSSKHTYQWDFGDGNTSTAYGAVHSYQSAGWFSVRLIVKDSLGCADTLIRTNYIQITKPTASFTMSDSISVCPPLRINFQSTSQNANSLLWDFGNSTSATQANPTTVFTSPGLYSVKLIVTSPAGCTDTATKSVRLLGYPGALTYTPLAGCVPLTVNFTNLLPNLVSRIVWDFSDGDTALVTTANYTHTYINAGAFVPKLIFYDSKGCSSFSLGIDTIKVDDVFAGFKTTTPCINTPMALVDTSHSLFSPVVSWKWTFGPGQVATGASAPRIYAAAGQYPVTLIVANARGCIDTITRNFTIHPLPVIKASPDTVVCVPDAVAITATGGKTYNWSPGSSLSCINCTSPMAAPTIPTSYIVIGTDSNDCSNKDTVRIGIQTLTSFTVSDGGEICRGQSFNLSATGATAYTWTPASSLSNANGASAIATPDSTTTYIATGREGSCIADTHLVRVIVNPLPTVNAGKDELIVAGTSVQLQASANGSTRVEWKSDSSLSCTNCYAPYAAPKGTTTYYITAYTNKGCIATDSVTVRVLCNSSQLYIPNTFTPNGDGLNDYFFPKGKGVEVIKSFRIYSRWGELLFERQNMRVNDEYAGWNGTHKGEKLNPDVFVYVIDATCDNGEPIQWKGDINLVR